MSVDLSRARIAGYLSAEDAGAIARNLGRITGVDGHVESLELVWGFEPVAALAKFGELMFI